jgi:hypothetical protein
METIDHTRPLMGHTQFLVELETPTQQAVSDVAVSDVAVSGVAVSGVAVSGVAVSDVPASAAPVAKARPQPVAFPTAAATRMADEPRRHGPQFMMPDANTDLIVEAAQSPATRRVLVVAGLVLMMLIGAAAAALVFHDRVAQIVSLWPIAGR